MLKKSVRVWISFVILTGYTSICAVMASYHRPSILKVKT
jgi:hypothetical protein